MVKKLQFWELLLWLKRGSWLKRAVFVVISVVKKGQFWVVIKRGSFGSYYCGLKGAVLGGY